MSSRPPRFRRFHRARFRLTLYYTIIQFFCLVILGTYLYYRNRRSMLISLEKFVRDDTNDLMAAVYDQKDDPAAIQRRLDYKSMGERYYELSFRLFDLEGRELACSRAFREAGIKPLGIEEFHDALEGDSTQEFVRLPDRDYRHLLFTRRWRDPEERKPRYVVQTLAYLEPIEKQSAKFLRSVVSAIPIFLLIYWFAGYSLARKVLRPVNQIARTARQITSSSLHERLVLSGTGDEFDMLASTLNDMIQRLGESFALTRQFAADAAHELRTPLTIMRGEAEVALRAKARSPEAYRDALESTIRECDRLIHIITQLLLLSQADAGAVHVERAPFRLDTLLQELAETFQVLAEDAQLTLEVQALPPVTVNGDRVRLHELFANLLDNAVKYTPPGGRVTLNVSLEPEEVRVAITDSGIGIPEDQQEKIFQRFYRVDVSRSRDTGGTGLGLSIARWIAHAHGGRIEVRSTVGAGSTFTVVLPLPVGTDSQAATEPADPGARDAQPRPA